MKLTKEHKAELKRTRSDDNGGSSSRGYQTGGRGYQGSGGGGREGRNFKKPRLQGRNFIERKANIRAKWEKQLAMKLDKPGSGWANKQEWHDPDMIN